MMLVASFFPLQSSLSFKISQGTNPAVQSKKNHLVLDAVFNFNCLSSLVELGLLDFHETLDLYIPRSPLLFLDLHPISSWLWGKEVSHPPRIDRWRCLLITNCVSNSLPRSPPTGDRRSRCCSWCVGTRRGQLAGWRPASGNARLIPKPRCRLNRLSEARADHAIEGERLEWLWNARCRLNRLSDWSKSRPRDWKRRKTGLFVCLLKAYSPANRTWSPQGFYKTCTLYKHKTYRHNPKVSPVGIALV